MAQNGRVPQERSQATHGGDPFAAALQTLTSSPNRLDAVREIIPPKPGLYAVYADTAGWIELGLGAPPDKRPLYVGKAEKSLISRDLDTHFRAGRTGSSTLRRSLAALLRDTLGLRGIPRNQSKPERPAQYALSREQDALLDAWMAAHLSLAFWIAPDGCAELRVVEIGVLSRLRPPLNLKDNPSPWQAKVAAAREAMATDVRRWCLERGLSLSVPVSAQRKERQK